MTDLRNQKRMAAELLKCGQGRVWIDPFHADDVAEAVTRSDVRNLIKKGVVKSKQKEGTSRGRARYLAQQKDKGRRRGPGSRKGAAGARSPRKEQWMNTIRPLRRKLRELRDSEAITVHQYRIYYRKAKGNSFRSTAHLVAHLKMDGVLSEEVV